MLCELPQTVLTARLSLPLVTLDDAADFKAGRRRPGWADDYPREDDVDACALIRPGSPAELSWGPRHLVRRNDGFTFGTIGFFGPPVPHGTDQVLETEVGFGMVPSARGRGVATEALKALVTACDAAGVRVRAGVAPENAASLKVLAKCGFTQLRGSTDEGELIMVRPLGTSRMTDGEAPSDS